jgi:hypothetical protein
MSVNSELIGIWREVLTAYCKAGAERLAGESEENHKNALRLVDLKIESDTS